MNVFSLVSLVLHTTVWVLERMTETSLTEDLKICTGCSFLLDDEEREKEDLASVRHINEHTSARNSDTTVREVAQS